MIRLPANIQLKDDQLQRFTDGVSGSLKSLSTIPILDGALLQDVVLIEGETTVNHGLGRKLRGYIIVSKNADADVWDSQSSNSIPDKTLTLETSGAVTVSLWVF